MFLVTSVAAGRIGDILGRRGTLLVGALVFAVGGAVQTFTPGFWVMVVGRVIAGFGVGLLSYVLSFLARLWTGMNGFISARTIVPIYQSEISPPNHVRLVWCLIFQCLIAPAERCTCLHGIHREHIRIRFLGCAYSLPSANACAEGWCQWIDYFCSYIDSDLSWRIPLFIQCVIGALLAAGSMMMPESPR